MGNNGRTPDCVSLSHTYMVFFLSLVLTAVLWGLGPLFLQWCAPNNQDALPITLHTVPTANVWVHSKIIVNNFLSFSTKTLFLGPVTMDDLLSLRPLLSLMLFSYACIPHFIMISLHFICLCLPKSLQPSFHVLLSNLFMHPVWAYPHALKQGDLWWRIGTAAHDKSPVEKSVVWQTIDCKALGPISW